MIRILTFWNQSVYTVTQWPEMLSASLAICEAWWRHQMETFSALLTLCAGNSPVSGEFPAQRPVTRSFDVFFDLRLIKRLSKHARGWWFEMLSRPLWRHCNGGIHNLLVDSSHKEQIRLSFDILLMLTWTICWTNGQDTGELIHHDAQHTEVTYRKLTDKSGTVHKALYFHSQSHTSSDLFKREMESYGRTLELI